MMALPIAGLMPLSALAAEIWESVAGGASGWGGGGVAAEGADAARVEDGVLAE